MVSSSLSVGGSSNAHLSCCVGMDETLRAARAPLEQNLLLEDSKGLLQACELCFEAALPLCVRLRLLHALLVELPEVIEDGFKFCLDTRTVGRVCSHPAIEVRILFGLVLHIL